MTLIRAASAAVAAHLVSWPPISPRWLSSPSVGVDRLLRGAKSRCLLSPLFLRRRVRRWAWLWSLTLSLRHRQGLPLRQEEPAVTTVASFTHIHHHTWHWSCLVSSVLVLKREQIPHGLVAEAERLLLCVWYTHAAPTFGRVYRAQTLG